MKYRRVGQEYIVRLEKGDIFFESLVPFLISENIESAFFSGIGGADWAELGIYNLKDKDYKWKYFAGPLEITSIMGNISKTPSGLKIHAHATISGTDMVVSGGHVKGIGISATCELVLRQTTEILNRSFDESIGLELLELDDGAT